MAGKGKLLGLSGGPAPRACGLFKSKRKSTPAAALAAPPAKLARTTVSPAPPGPSSARGAHASAAAVQPVGSPALSVLVPDTPGTGGDSSASDDAFKSTPCLIPDTPTPPSPSARPTANIGDLTQLNNAALTAELREGDVASASPSFNACEMPIELAVPRSVATTVELAACASGEQQIEENVVVPGLPAGANRDSWPGATWRSGATASLSASDALAPSSNGPTLDDRLQEKQVQQFVQGGGSAKRQFVQGGTSAKRQKVVITNPYERPAAAPSSGLGACGVKKDAKLDRTGAGGSFGGLASREPCKKGNVGQPATHVLTDAAAATEMAPAGLQPSLASSSGSSGVNSTSQLHVLPLSGEEFVTPPPVALCAKQAGDARWERGKRGAGARVGTRGFRHSAAARGRNGRNGQRGQWGRGGGGAGSGGGSGGSSGAKGAHSGTVKNPAAAAAEAGGSSKLVGGSWREELSHRKPSLRQAWVVQEEAANSMKTRKEILAAGKLESEPELVPSSQAILSGGATLRTQLATYGVPPCVQETYAEAGVTQLLDWQAECLMADQGKALSWQNLVFCAPTSGGKTLVAEVLMLRSWLQFRRLILFVVPFVALAEEKAAYLARILRPLGMEVCALHGGGSGADLDPTDPDAGIAVAVCTIERANGIVNRLAEERRLGALALVVVDELHFLADKMRGYILELTLTKLRFAAEHVVQIVGLSATLPNLAEIANWLKAVLYTTTRRPVKLDLYICTEGKVFLPEQVGNAPSAGAASPTSAAQGSKRVSAAAPSPVRELPPGKDTDGALALLAEVVAAGRSGLVFCFSRVGCQNFANLLKELLVEDWRENEERRRQQSGSSAPEPAAHGSGAAGSTLRATVGSAKSLGGATNFCSAAAASRSASVDGPASVTHLWTEELKRERQALADELWDLSRGTAAEQCELVRFGVAYHHAGVPAPERALLEAAYRDGRLCVLVATTTLAAGVNLPAHTVVIRSESMGGAGELIDAASFHQMTGRAGRLGQPCPGNVEDSSSSIRRSATEAGGSAYIIVKEPKHLKEVAQIISAPLKPIVSALRPSNDNPEALGRLERALLEAVVGKLARTCKELQLFASKTLFAQGATAAEVSVAVGQALAALRDFVVLTDGPAAPRDPDGAAPQAQARAQSVQSAAAAIDPPKVPPGPPIAAINPYQAKVRTDAKVPAPECGAAGAAAGGKDGRGRSSCVTNALATASLGEGHNPGGGYKEPAVVVVNVAEQPKVLEFTQLALAAFFSGMSTTEARQAHESWKRARREGLCLTADLHLLFLVTPARPRIKVKWELMRDMYESAGDRCDFCGVAEAVGVSQQLVTDMARRGSAQQHAGKETKEVAAARRLYAALVLQKLVDPDELPEHTEEAFGASQADVEALQRDAAALCSMTTCFLHYLKWTAMEKVVAPLRNRLSLGASQELVQLMRLGPELMPKFRAQALLKARIKTTMDVINADQGKLAELLQRSGSFEGGDATEAAQRARKKRAALLATRIRSAAQSEVRRAIMAEQRRRRSRDAAAAAAAERGGGAGQKSPRR